jgi:hypothetical protein
MVMSKFFVAHANKQKAARTGTMWTMLFVKYVTDDIELVVHIYLLAGDVLATIAIGFAILWEHGPPSVRKIANLLIIWGVVTETLCSVALFTFDEAVSNAQGARVGSILNELCMQDNSLINNAACFGHHLSSGNRMPADPLEMPFPK